MEQARLSAKIGLPVLRLACTWECRKPTLLELAGAGAALAVSDRAGGFQSLDVMFVWQLVGAFEAVEQAHSGLIDVSIQFCVLREKELPGSYVDVLAFVLSSFGKKLLLMRCSDGRIQSARAWYE